MKLFRRWPENTDQLFGLASKAALTWHHICQETDLFRANTAMKRWSNILTPGIFGLGAPKNILSSQEKIERQALSTSRQLETFNSQVKLLYAMADNDHSTVQKALLKAEYKLCGTNNSLEPLTCSSYINDIANRLHRSKFEYTCIQSLAAQYEDLLMKSHWLLHKDPVTRTKTKRYGNMASNFLPGGPLIALLWMSKDPDLKSDWDEGMSDIKESLTTYRDMFREAWNDYLEAINTPPTA